MLMDAVPGHPRVAGVTIIEVVGRPGLMAFTADPSLLAQP
jgi:hypothetical protein